MISVIVPVYNEEQYITRCLEALSRQTLRDPFEIIVVNNASTDGTVHVVEAFAKQHPQLALRLITELRRGIAYACQTGVTQANYPIIARTDADTIVPTTWLEQLELHFNDPITVAIGGVVSYDHHRLFTALTSFLHRLHASLGFPLYFGANLAVRAVAIQQVGGFNTALTRSEDLELSFRLRSLYRSSRALQFDSRIRVLTSYRKYRRGWQTLRLIRLGSTNYLAFWFQYLWRLRPNAEGSQMIP